MLDSLPYELPELVTRAPLDIHRSVVLPEWVDWNGHMNVAFYVSAFDQASGAFMRNMGLGRRYVDGKLGMTFVLETHVTYDRELREGAPMRFTTQLLARDVEGAQVQQLRVATGRDDAEASQAVGRLTPVDGVDGAQVGNLAEQLEQLLGLLALDGGGEVEVADHEDGVGALGGGDDGGGLELLAGLGLLLGGDARVGQC